MRRFIVLLALLLSARALTWADTLITREYRLKNTDMADISRVLNIAAKDVTQKRIIGGQGKRLVITDTPEQQDAIAEILPVIDQPTQQTVPYKVQLEMMSRISRYNYDHKKSMKMAQKSGPEPSASASTPAPPGGVATYDKRSSTQPYKSIYSSEDAEITKKPRKILDEPTLPSLTSLTLKGIFEVNAGNKLALLICDGVSYTARDGGLFERNHTRVKGVTSRVLKDRVILVGPDRIPREIKFISTL